MPGDGSTTNFEFSFSGGYISQDHVVVTTITEAGVEALAEFTWVGEATINVTPAPATGVTVRIRRITPNNASDINFSDGAIVTDENLDRVAQQALFAAADAADTGLIAVDELRRNAATFSLWTAAGMAAWLKEAMVTAIGPLYRGPKGDQGDEGPVSTVPGPEGPRGPEGPVGPPSADTDLYAYMKDNFVAGANLTAAYDDALLKITFNAVSEITASVAWGGVTGTLTDQVDLATALSGKLAVVDNSADWGTGAVRTAGDVPLSVGNLTTQGTATIANNAGGGVGYVEVSRAGAAGGGFMGGALTASGRIPLGHWGNTPGFEFDTTPYVGVNAILTAATGAPLAHTHTIAQVDGLQGALDTLQVTVDAKADPGDFAAIDHTHAQADVSGLTTALNAKQKQITSGTTAPSGGSSGDVYFKVA